MKTTLFLSLLISLALNSVVFSQTQHNNISKSDQHIPKFMPDIFENTSLISSHNIHIGIKKSTVLYGAGYLLQGLKFRSVVDQFNATVPFDIRGYKPTSFSSYSQVITQNYLLTQSTQPLK